jgi:hypothetical protein
MKAGTVNFGIVRTYAISGGGRVWFDLLNGTIGTENTGLTGKIENYGNGWYRCSITGVIDTTGAIDFAPAPADNDFTSNAVGESIYLYGGQLEINSSYATSMIPTEGSTVTRNQDVCNNGGTGTGLINSTEGVLYWEGKRFNNDFTNTAISLNNGSFSNSVAIKFRSNENLIFALVYSNSNLEALMQYTVSDITDFTKIAISYAENNFALWVNGLKVLSDTSGNIPIGLTNLSFNTGGTVENFYGKTKALAVWKEALSDQELAELTYPTPTLPTFTLDFNTIAEQFTFARGSEATYVDAQGLIKSTNVLGSELVSNGSFDTDTDWTLGAGVTISGGEANWTNTINNVGVTQSGIMTSGKNYKVVFTVSNYSSGSVRLRFPSITERVTSNGTYTYYINATDTNLYIQGETNGDANVNFSIDNVSVKEHITATNTPRLDYSTGAEAFLLEPQSTNLIAQSETFNDAYWTKSGTSITPNATTSPDGTTNADNLVEDSANSQHYLQRNFTSTTGSSYTYKIYVKMNGRRNISLRENGSTGYYVSFDLLNGVILEQSNATGTIKELTNGWFEITHTSVAGNSFNVAYYLLSDSYTSGNPQTSPYQGDGVSGFYIWGAMLEQQSYATSYIKSEGSQTTRNQETCINATPEINSEEGVLYAEISALTDDGTNRFISLSDGTISNRINIVFDTSNNINARQAPGGVNISTSGINILNSNKIAYKYQNGSQELWVNGVKIGTTNVTSLPSGLDRLSFDSFNGGDLMFGNTKDLQYYTKALSDAELIKLTTI